MEFILKLMGAYYLITGLWPLVHMKSFEMVSGYKSDKWLVRTVSLMILSSGIIFLNFSDAESTKWLAIMNASALAFIDIWYSLRGVIRKVYLLDGICEIIFLILILTK